MARRNRLEAAEEAKERGRLIDAVIRSLFEPSEWEKLPPPVQVRLRAKWNRDLDAQSTDMLRQLANPDPRSPAVYSDETFTLHFARQTTGSGSKDEDVLLLQRIEQVNRRIRKIVHGTDAKGVYIATDMSHVDRHHFVLGVTGMGKSTYMASLFCQLATRDGPMVLLDPHSKSLINEILPNLPRERLKDVVYIDVTDRERSWGINLLQLARSLTDAGGDDQNQIAQYVIEDTVNTIVGALSIIQEDQSGFSAGPSIQSMMRMGFLSAAEREDTSLVDAYFFLTDNRVRDEHARHIVRPHVRSYFFDAYPRFRPEFIERVRNKLDVFLNTIMVNTFSRREECTSLQNLLAQNKILVFDLDRRKMPPLVSSLIGYLVLTVLQLAVDRRPEDQLDKPLLVMADEFQNFASKTTIRWLAEARKKNAALVLGFQHLSQLPDDVREALGNAGTKAIFRTTAQDAALLCPVLGLTGPQGQPRISELTDMPAYVMKLHFDEDDPEALRPGTRRSLVAVNALKPFPRQPHADAIIARIRDVSRRRYYRPNKLADGRSVFFQRDDTRRQVLESLHALTFASRTGQTYHLPLPADESRARRLQEDLDRRRVTLQLIQADLEARGYRLPESDVARLLRLLNYQRLIHRRKTETDDMSYDLAPRGLRELESYVNPGTSSNEGGPAHKTGVLLTYSGLQGLSPTSIEMPSQGTNTYAPDLIAHAPRSKAPQNWINHMTRRRGIHFHIEEGGRTKTQKILEKAQGALTEGFDPIFVIASKLSDPTADAREQHTWLLHLIDNKKETKPSAELDPIDQSALRASIRVWAISKTGRLFEYDPGSDRAIPVEERYFQPVPGAIDRPEHPEIVPSELLTSGSPEAGVANPGAGNRTFHRIVQDMVLASLGVAILEREILGRLREHPETASMDAAHLEQQLRDAYGMRRVESPDGPGYLAT